MKSTRSVIASMRQGKYLTFIAIQDVFLHNPVYLLNVFYTLQWRTVIFSLPNCLLAYPLLPEFSQRSCPSKNSKNTGHRLSEGLISLPTVCMLQAFSWVINFQKKKKKF